jgi:hypothetical protein
MQVQIVLAPDLAINVDEFITDWNAAPQALARAERGDAATVAYPLDPQWQHALVFLAGVASTITIDVLKEVIKTQVNGYLARQRKPQPQPITVNAVPQPDGAVLLVVHKE